MKVEQIEVYLVSIPLDLEDSTRKVDKVGYTVVEIKTDEGVTGVGMTYHEVGGEAIRQLIKKDLAWHVIGKDPFATEAIWEEIFHFFRGVARRGLAFSALSALDIALWDLKGKILGLPLYKLLGGNKTRIPVYTSGGWTSYSEDELVAEMQSMVDAGYKMVKMKAGVKWGTAPHEDIARIKRVRKELGPEIEILVDVNNAYTAGTAIRVGKRIEECDIYLYEEPVLADDMEGLARVRQSVNIPIGTGEHEYTKYGVRDLLKNKAVDILQVDVTRCGGITEFMKIAAMAHAYNIVVAPHGMELMHLHLLGAINNGLVLERLKMFEPLSDLVFTNAPQPKDGYLEIPNRPGLGLELNKDYLVKHDEK